MLCSKAATLQQIKIKKLGKKLKNDLTSEKVTSVFGALAHQNMKKLVKLKNGKKSTHQI